MKRKWRFRVLLIFLVLMATLCAVYLFIPARITVSRIITAKFPVNRGADFFVLKDQLIKWNDSGVRDGQLCTHNYCFRFYDYTNGTVAVKTTYAGKELIGYIQFTRLATDSGVISWSVTLPPSGVLPWNRVASYFKAKQLKSAISETLNRFTVFAGNHKRLYGIEPQIERVVDSLSLSQKKTFAAYPTLPEIYGLVSELENYVKAAGDSVVRAPMLHMQQNAAAQYEVMVSVPIQKPLTGNDRFVLKRMPPGRMLRAGLTGGPFTIQQGLQAIELYKNDNQLTAPAIPYQRMVTNRLTEPDTTKWITELNYPVF